MLFFLWGVDGFCAVLFAAHINVTITLVQKIASGGQHYDDENGDAFVAHG